jgi:O-antigen/teichoic acid export membrane protein
MTVLPFTNASRSFLVKRNIAMSMFLRLVSLCLGFLLVPLTIKYLSSAQYGIWVTLLSILSWTAYFDMGLGLCLRNKLVEVMASNDRAQAGRYVSTAYYTLGGIASLAMGLLVAIVRMIPWQKVFNTTVVSKQELELTVLVVGILYFTYFVLSLGSSIAYAFHRASLVAGQQIFQQVLMLGALLVLPFWVKGGIFIMGSFYAVSLLLSSLSLNAYLFREYSFLLPRWKSFDKTSLAPLSSLGGKFLLLQLSVLIIFATDNMIITYVLGPERVTIYNVAYQLFSIVVMLHALVITPLCSAQTDAYVRNDLVWNKSVLKKLNFFMLPVIVVVFMLVVFSNEIINLWVGSQFLPGKTLVAFMALYALIAVWTNIYAYFLNASGRLSFSIVLAVMGAVFNIPLSIYLVKNTTLGESGVILATILCLLPSAIFLPLYAWHVLHSNPSNKNLISVEAM